MLVMMGLICRHVKPIGSSSRCVLVAKITATFNTGQDTPVSLIWARSYVVLPSKVILQFFWPVSVHLNAKEFIQNRAGSFHTFSKLWCTMGPYFIFWTWFANHFCVTWSLPCSVRVYTNSPAAYLDKNNTKHNYTIRNFQSCVVILA